MLGHQYYNCSNSLGFLHQPHIYTSNLNIVKSTFGGVYSFIRHKTTTTIKTQISPNTHTRAQFPAAALRSHAFLQAQALASANVSSVPALLASSRLPSHKRNCDSMSPFSPVFLSQHNHLRSSCAALRIKNWSSVSLRGGSHRGSSAHQSEDRRVVHSLWGGGRSCCEHLCTGSCVNISLPLSWVKPEEQDCWVRCYV